VELEKGKLYAFFIDTTLKWDKNQPDAFFTNATEEEFYELLDNFIAENDANGKDKLDTYQFKLYLAKSGYYVYAEFNKVLPPYAPFK